MRIVCVWRRESDYGREVEGWLRDFEQQTGREIESVDPDSVAGSQFVATYDVVEYPTILALGEDGSVKESWRGKMLPRVGQVGYWVQ